MPLTATLQTIARADPHQPAITSDAGTLTFGQFEAQVATIAGTLRTRYGLAPGDRVALFMDNDGAYFPLLFGCWRAGLAAVPVNAKLHAKEFAWIVENAGASLAIVSAKLAASLGTDLSDLPPVIVAGTRAFRILFEGDDRITDAPVDPAAEAWLFYTSGTTGRPKGAVLTHRNLLFACHAYYADIDPLGFDDCIVHAAPLTHGSGLYGLAHILKGSHQLIHPGFEPAAIADVLRRHRNVSMFAAPTMVTRLLDHPEIAAVDPAHLKCLIYGGAPMYLADLQRALALFGPRLYQLYGQGESPMTITGVSKALHADTTHPRYLERLASVGIARTGVAYRIVDPEGRDLPAGEIGEVITRSDCVMPGYWANPEANATALRDGWLWTGDMGARDSEGFLTLKDRSKDMIISGGSNIYPREIEELLLRHPGVAECAVIGRPHGDWGEEVVAVVVARGDAPAVDASALDQLCLDNIARFKRPKAYRFVSALPKNAYGKVLKTELRALLAADRQEG
jgi:acyl-CoA synthetase (AMP-forming)/AMP-acid ligase II